MKGLLLKDFYVMTRACRVHLGFIILFSVMSLFIDLGLLYLAYPILFAGMIPVYVLSVDEKTGWNRYAQAMPYTRRDIVTGKYITALIVLGLSSLWMLLLWSARIALLGGSMAALFKTMGVVFCVGLLFPTLSLPMMLRFGVEKGRFVTMGVAAFLAIVVVLTGFALTGPMDDPAAEAVSHAASSVDLASFLGLNLPVMIAIAAALFALSWLLAVRLYKRREL